MRTLLLILLCVGLANCKSDGSSDSSSSSVAIEEAKFFDRSGYSGGVQTLVNNDSLLNTMFTAKIGDVDEYKDIAILSRIRAHVHFYENSNDIYNMCNVLSSYLNDLGVVHDVLQFQSDTTIPVINSTEYCLVNAYTEEGDSAILDPISNTLYFDDSNGTRIIGFNQLIEKIQNQELDEVRIGSYGYNAPPLGNGTESGPFSWLLRDGFGLSQGVGYVYFGNRNLDQNELKNFEDFISTAFITQTN